MYRSSYTTGVETYPYLALEDGIPSLNMEWSCKINPCESKGGLLVHSEIRQWRWRWRFSFKSSANDTAVYELLARPFTIQNFDLTSTRVSLTPLWNTRRCARLTTKVVRWCCLGNSIGCLVPYGMVALDRRLQTLFSSKKRPSQIESLV